MVKTGIKEEDLGLLGLFLFYNSGIRCVVLNIANITNPIIGLDNNRLLSLL